MPNDIIDPARNSAWGELTPIDTYWDSEGNIQYGMQAWIASGNWGSLHDITEREVPAQATAVILAPISWTMKEVSMYYMFSPTLLTVDRPTFGLYLSGFGSLPVKGRKAMDLLRVGAGKVGDTTQGTLQYFTGDVGPMALPVHTGVFAA